MIFTFEGAPASGKSTVSEALATAHGCYIVPEVNKLFGKENRTSDLWYYQKQALRWDLAKQNQNTTSLSILDGDVFQPLWFSSFYPDENWGHFDDIVKFYATILKHGSIGLPNMYVYFHTEERIRAEREKERSMCLGRSPETVMKKIVRHRDFAIIQKAYFSDLKAEFPDLVVFLESSNLANSMQSILSYTQKRQYKNTDIFNFIVDWCKHKNQTCKTG